MKRPEKCSIRRTIDRLSRGVHFQLAGEIDAHDTPPMEASIREWIHRHGGSVVIDIRDVRYQSSAFIKMLVRFHMESRQREADLVLITNAFQDRLLRIFSLDRLFLAVKTREEAASLLRDCRCASHDRPPLGITA